MRADEWPEKLPPASPPPGESRRHGWRLAPGEDPGHLFTEEEWAQIQADAEAADDVRAEDPDDAT